jgi:hypothetical protein
MNLASAALQRGKASLNSSASANYPVDHDGARSTTGRIFVMAVTA